MPTTPTPDYLALCPESRGRGTCAAANCQTCAGLGFVIPAGCKGTIVRDADDEAAVVHDEPCPLHSLPRAEAWHGSEGMLFACPLPAYRMVADEDDPDADPTPRLVVCGSPLNFEQVDGGQFWGDLDQPDTGPSWQLGCDSGHVLTLSEGDGDMPSAELAFTPSVALSALYMIGVRSDG